MQKHFFVAKTDGDERSKIHLVNYWEIIASEPVNHLIYMGSKIEPSKALCGKMFSPHSGYSLSELQHLENRETGLISEAETAEEVFWFELKDKGICTHCLIKYLSYLCDFKGKFPRGSTPKEQVRFLFAQCYNKLGGDLCEVDILFLKSYL